MSDIEYRIYDPKEDFIFKMIFGSEENKSILIIKYDIEMQCRKTKDIPNRAVYYASKLFTKDLKENDDYNKSRVISIWIFAENVTNRKSAISEALMTFQPNKEDKYEILTDNIRIIYLELRKYLINSYNYNDKLTKWVDFLTNNI